MAELAVDLELLSVAVVREGNGLAGGTDLAPPVLFGVGIVGPVGLGLHEGEGADEGEPHHQSDEPLRLHNRIGSQSVKARAGAGLPLKQTAPKLGTPVQAVNAVRKWFRLGGCRLHASRFGRQILFMEASDLRSDFPSPWGRHVLDRERVTLIRFGPREFRLRARDGEIWIADSFHDPTSRPDGGDPGILDESDPANLSWSRWATPAGERELLIRPILPERPLVLEPERPFWLLPAAELRIYVRIPLFVRIELPAPGGHEGALLEEVPAVALSDTWWGDFMTGELCYWLPTTARREMRTELFADHLAVCPLVLTNRSSGDLRVEKLALRVAHLSLFVHEEHLWTDEVTVRYQGDAEGSQIEMAGRAPVEARSGVRVGKPRSPVPRGFRARTFDLFRTLPGMGGAL